jgi:hypothetical protein
MVETKVISASDDEVTSWSRYVCFIVADNNYEGKLYWDSETGYEIYLHVGDLGTLEKDVPELNDWFEELDSLSYDEQLAQEARVKKSKKKK